MTTITPTLRKASRRGTAGTHRSVASTLLVPVARRTAGRFWDADQPFYLNLNRSDNRSFLSVQPSLPLYLQSSPP